MDLMMSHIINLYVLDKILNEDAQINLSAKAKMIYINCLTHKFKDKPARVTNAVAFEIMKSDFKNYDKFRPYIEELHKAELVVMSADYITFVNCWGRHIDKSKLEKVSPDEYVAGFNFSPVEAFESELENNQMLFETLQLKYDIREDEIRKLIVLFIKEQKTFDKKYNGWSDCVKHFTFWIGHNKKKLNIATDINKAEKVISKGKILGI